jgi:hypothetical protein
MTSYKSKFIESEIHDSEEADLNKIEKIINEISKLDQKIEMIDYDLLDDDIKRRLKSHMVSLRDMMNSVIEGYLS